MPPGTPDTDPGVSLGTRLRTRKAGSTGSPARRPVLPARDPGVSLARGPCGPNQPRGLWGAPAHTCKARHTPVNRKVLWKNTCPQVWGFVSQPQFSGKTS